MGYGLHAISTTQGLTASTVILKSSATNILKKQVKLYVTTMIKRLIDYVKGLFIVHDTKTYRSVTLSYEEWYLVKVALSIRIKKLRYFAEIHPDSADLLNAKARKYAKTFKSVNNQVYFDNVLNTEELCKREN